MISITLLNLLPPIYTSIFHKLNKPKGNSTTLSLHFLSSCLFKTLKTPAIFLSCNIEAKVRNMKVAVVGAGISGLVSAYELAKSGVQVVVYEKDDYLGGHAKTVTVDDIDLDLGFMIFNRVTYPNMMEFFECLGVDTGDL
ncbi:hypothetical protein HAX54_008932 [Datura stramonium]|uniref:Uncharacterized protein n=1 Tax=Datura stramonium TaxID=4076 RepID=A0ABS8TE50_DATST|nr:hypothetical protein [Datura stramonium]